MPKQHNDTITHATPRQVYDTMDAAWDRLGLGTKSPTGVVLLVAQWALETGRGASMHCNNIGNIKGRPDGSDGHDWTFYRCDEIIGGKRVWFEPPNPGCCFRAYDTLELGVEDYLALLHRRYAKAWGSVIAGSPTAFAHDLKLGGYYTASETLYAKGLRSLFLEFCSTILDSDYDLSSTSDLQRALNELGEDPPIAVDGILGPGTIAAIKSFQRKHGLVADGIAGPKTRSAMVQALKVKA
jgi:hypothetical protein